MLSDTIRRQISRCNRNLLLVNFGVVLGALIWVYGGQRYLYNCYAGPQQITASDVVTAGSQFDHRYFVSISDLQPLDGGLQDTETSYGHTSVTAHYYVAPVDGRFLLIKSKSDKPEAHYEGGMVPVPSDVQASFQREILSAKSLNFNQVFVPYMLDATSFRSDAYIGFAIGMPIVLLAAYNVRKALIRIRDVHESPIYKWLKHYQEPPEAISMLIENDLKQGTHVSIASLTMTSSWLLHKTFFGYATINFAEIVWVYKKVTRHSVNLVPTGKSHGLIVADRSGRKTELDIGRGKSQEGKVTNFIQTLAGRVPWVVFGYSDDLKNLYEKNRPDFVAAVQQRYAEACGSSSADAAHG